MHISLNGPSTKEAKEIINQSVDVPPDPPNILRSRAFGARQHARCYPATLTNSPPTQKLSDNPVKIDIQLCQMPNMQFLRKKSNPYLYLILM